MVLIQNFPADIFKEFMEASQNGCWVFNHQRAQGRMFLLIPLIIKATSLLETYGQTRSKYQYYPEALRAVPLSHVFFINFFAFLCIVSSFIPLQEKVSELCHVCERGILQKLVIKWEPRLVDMEKKLMILSRVESHDCLLKKV